MFCKYCGKEVEDSEICPNCGKILNTVTNVDINSKKILPRITELTKKKKIIIGVVIAAVIVIAVIAFLLLSQQDGQKFMRNTSWGMSVTEVKNIEKADMRDDFDGERIRYDLNQMGLKSIDDSVVNYVFDSSSSLKAIEYALLDDGTDPTISDSITYECIEIFGDDYFEKTGQLSGGTMGYSWTKDYGRVTLEYVMDGFSVLRIAKN